MKTGIWNTRTRRWAAVAGGATAIALFFALQNIVGAAARGRAIDWGGILWTELYYWYLLALFLPLVLWLAHHLRMSRGRYVRIAAAHSGAALLIGLVHSLLYYVPLAALLISGPLLEEVGQRLPTAIMTVFWKYWVVVGVYYAFDYHRKYRERQDHAAALERSLTEARLQALRMQLHPHFLFNSLNTVAMLNLEDPHAANRVLSRLSELLRRALETEDVQEVRLAEELEFIRRYLEIEQARFEDRLRVEVGVPSELLDAFVPNLILQPLVENAVRHGLAPRKRAGTIRIHARRTGPNLRIEVCDNGGGLPDTQYMEVEHPVAGHPEAGGPESEQAHTEGIGLDNTRARLEGLYGEAGRLDLEEAPGGGMCAVLELPYHIRPFRSEGSGAVEGEAP